MLRTPLRIAFAILAMAASASAQDQTARFTGAWTGVQRLKVDTPSPNAREAQPVSLTIRMLDGKIHGVMTPFLGGAEGATFTDGRIVGNELRAIAVMGFPQAAADPSDWKGSVQIAFVFTLEGNSLTGVANLVLGDVPWLKLEYRLTRQ